LDTRGQLLRRIANEITSTANSTVSMIGIDGVDGAGKTCFADELARCISDVPVIRASIDAFHNPRRIRYAKGKDSPQGYFEDSFNYDLLTEYLLDPLSPGGSMKYRTEAFDYRIDEPVDSPICVAQVPALLLFDGIFLHRPELIGYWDYSVFLHVSPRESVRRCIARAGAEGPSTDPDDPVHRRYVVGQKKYLDACNPMAHATLVVDNDDFDAPYIANGWTHTDSHGI
jgi:uridine kinase